MSTCQHAGCTCEARAQDQFCSDQCREQASHPSDGMACGCNHEGCECGAS